MEDAPGSSETSVVHCHTPRHLLGIFDLLLLGCLQRDIMDSTRCLAGKHSNSRKHRDGAVHAHSAFSGACEQSH